MFSFASLVTLSLIFSFVFVILFLAAYFGGALDIQFVLLGTIVINLIIWLVAPFFMDLMFRWIYKCEHLSLEDLKARSARLADFISRICSKYNLPIPRIRLIKDDNPTAFVFGSGAFNARLVFSEGLFTYLAEDEIEAVIAHELGHIQRRDFIIMTIAQTLVQLLYELSQYLMRSRSSNEDKNKALFYVGAVAYVLFWVSTYLLLYLSRTREYGADRFAAENIENPDSLSRALIKVAYGIVAKPDSASQNRLLSSTRALGLIDTNSAKMMGSAYEISSDWNFISKVLLFDLVSPWAKVIELGSTHPLTGKRITELDKICDQKGSKKSIDLALVKHETYDKSRLYSGFAFGVFIHFLPQLSVLVALIIGGIMKNIKFIALIPFLLGLSIIIKILYRYPNSQAKKMSTLELMSDVYASPVRGFLAELDGKIIGRGQAGHRFAEDVMIQDKTGLLYLNYESAFGFIGNFIFGLSKVKQLIGKEVKVNGWFFRGVAAHMDLHQISDNAGSAYTSRPALWGLLGGFVLIAIALFWTFGGSF